VTERSRVQLPAVALSGKNSGQVVRTHVPLVTKQYNLLLDRWRWYCLSCWLDRTTYTHTGKQQAGVYGPEAIHIADTELSGWVVWYYQQLIGSLDSSNAYWLGPFIFIHFIQSLVIRRVHHYCTVYMCFLKFPILWSMFLPRIGKIGWHLSYHKYKNGDIFFWDTVYIAVCIDVRTNFFWGWAIFARKMFRQRPKNCYSNLQNCFAWLSKNVAGRNECILSFNKYKYIYIFYFWLLASDRKI